MVDEKEYSLKVSKLEKEANVIFELDEPLLHKLMKGLEISITSYQEIIDLLMKKTGASRDEKDVKSYKDSLDALNKDFSKHYKLIYDLMERRRKSCYTEIKRLKEELLRGQASEQQK